MGDPVVVTKIKRRKQGRKGKRKDERPARARYWASGGLRRRKVRNLVRCCGMTPAAAEEHWLRVRAGRRTPAFKGV